MMICGISCLSFSLQIPHIPDLKLIPVRTSTPMKYLPSAYIQEKIIMYVKTITIETRRLEGKTCSTKCPKDICSNRIVHINCWYPIEAGENYQNDELCILDTGNIFVTSV